MKYLYNELGRQILEIRGPVNLPPRNFVFGVRPDAFEPLSIVNRILASMSENERNAIESSRREGEEWRFVGRFLRTVGTEPILHQADSVPSRAPSRAALREPDPSPLRQCVDCEFACSRVSQERKRGQGHRRARARLRPHFPLPPSRSVQSPPDSRCLRGSAGVAAVPRRSP